MGKRVVKAFLPTDWEFYGDTGATIGIHPLNSEPQDFPPKPVSHISNTKNRQNGQKLTLVTDYDHPNICPVRAAYRIFLRAKRLGQSDLQLLGLFVNKFGITKYLTGNKIADTLLFAARTAHPPDMPDDELKRFSSHLGRVWALVLLDEAGMTPDFMKSCLRWMGDSYRLYLRDTSILQQKHVEALKKDSNENTAPPRKESRHLTKHRYSR